MIELIVVTDENFEQTVIEGSKKGEAVLLFATAAWCGQSKTILEIAPKMADDYQGRIKFAWAEIENKDYKVVCPKIKQECNIEKYPSMVLFKDGKQIASQTSEKIPMRQLLDIKDICIEGLKK